MALGSQRRGELRPLSLVPETPRPEQINAVGDLGLSVRGGGHVTTEHVLHQLSAEIGLGREMGVYCHLDGNRRIKRIC